MSLSLYPNAVRAVLDHLEQTQAAAIEQAAELVVHALTHGGVVFCAEIGHGNQYDFLNRAGGLAAVRHLQYKVDIQSSVADCLRDRPRAEPVDAELERARIGLRHGNVRAGDVLLVSSVSGKGRGPTELAIAAREIGVKTVGFTAMEYTKKVIAGHPSGKKLYEVVDVVVDIGAPYGDAAVEIAGIDHKVLPVSGVAMICAGWMIWGRVMELMATARDPPTVFQSVNREGGMEEYHEKVKQYNGRGY